MANKKESYLEKIRGKMKDAAEKAVLNQTNGLEWSPDFGSHKIRILPPVDEEDMFYHTHCYHFIPNDPDDLTNGSGRYLWARKWYEVEVNGKTVRKQCPICEAVRSWYAIGRKENNDALTKMAGALKLKRNFFLNILLLDEEDPEKRYKILVDRTNEGKLIRMLCGYMGMPFFRDIEDQWVDKASLEIDEERDYFDLLDPIVGHDFKIVKKKTGVNPWDISFEESFPLKTPRELTDEEKELLKKRVDLKSHVNYEESYDFVKATLEKFIGEDVEEEVKEEKPEVLMKQAPTSKPAKTDAPKKEASDKEIESMLDQLD